MSKYLIVGAGGFIGGHLVKKLFESGHQVRAVDIKPKELWFQDFEEVENFYSMDMKNLSILFLIWHATWVVWVLLKIIKQNACYQF